MKDKATIRQVYQQLKQNIRDRIRKSSNKLSDWEPQENLEAQGGITALSADYGWLSDDAKIPGTGGVRTFITGRNKLTYDFIDLDQYYIKDEVDNLIQAEAVKREEADKNLQDMLEVEISNREAEDKTLSSQISTILSSYVTSVKATSSSSILTASPSSAANGAVTVTVGLDENALKQWLDDNGYGGGSGELTYTDKYVWSNLALSYQTAAATDTSLGPPITGWHLERIRTYSDGTTETTTWDTWQVTASYSYSISSNFSGVSIDSNGVITFPENTSTSQRVIGTVTLTITVEGQSTTVQCVVYQAGTGEVTYEYSTPSVTLTYTDVPANGGTATPTCTYTQTRTGSDGSSTTITSGGSLSYSATDSGMGDWQLDGSTGVVTKSSENSSDQRAHLGEVSVTVALNGKTGTADCWVYQAAGESTEVTYTYGDITASLSYNVSTDRTNTSYQGGDFEPVLTYSQVRTGSDGSSVTLTSGASLSWNDRNIDSSVASLNTSTGVLTLNHNYSYETRSVGYVQVQVSMNGKSATVSSGDITQGAIVLPVLSFMNLSCSPTEELTDASLINVRAYEGMQHESGTAMTIGVSMPTGSSGNYFFNVGIWFDYGESSSNVNLNGNARYVCIYHNGNTVSTDLGGSVDGLLGDIDHSGESSIGHGDGYSRLYINNVSLAIGSTQDGAVLLQLDLIQYFTDLIGQTEHGVVYANRYLRLSYVGNGMPTTDDEFAEHIRAELIAH